MITRQDLFHTLEVCEKYLPGNADSVHYERLRYLRRLLSDPVMFANLQDLKLTAERAGAVGTLTLRGLEPEAQLFYQFASDRGDEIMRLDLIGARMIFVALFEQSTGQAGVES